MKNLNDIPETTLDEHSIVENQEIAPQVHLISVKRTFEFTPGQVVWITCDPTIPPRMYSICSGNKDTFLQILFDVKEDGKLTPKLSKLRAGDLLLVSPPSGYFYPRSKDSFWIASGTGIAPYISLLSSESVENIHLIHGARTLEGFYFQKFLETKTEIDYIRCCSRELHEGVYSGRLTKYLKESSALPKNQMYFLCGSAEMVVDTRDLLLKKEIEFSKIASEIYF